MDDVVLVARPEDRVRFLADASLISQDSFREKPYSLIISRPLNEVKEILGALQPDPNLKTLFITNGSGKLKLNEAFQGTYPGITKLGFINCGLQDLPEDLYQYFPNVEELVLSRNKIEELPRDFGRFARLHTLRINHTNLQELPDSLDKLSSLRRLYCAHNKLKTLPITLVKLSLVRIDVRDNAITTLPTIMAGRLERMVSFQCSGNPLTKNLGSDKKEDLVSYLQELSEGVVDNREVKLAVVGEEGVGKTTLVQALRAKSKVCKKGVEKTDGIDVSPVQIEDITFNVFDIAGDVDFLETHLLFTSSNCLYLHVYNLAAMGVDDETGILLGRLEMWLKAICVQAPESRTLIVGTHADDWKHGEEMGSEAKKQLGSLLEEAREAHTKKWKADPVEDCLICPEDDYGPDQVLSDAAQSPFEDSPGNVHFLQKANIPHVVGCCEVSSVKKYPATIASYLPGGTNASVKELERLLLNSGRKLLRDGAETPRKWLNLIEHLRTVTDGNLPVLHIEEATKIAEENGVTDHAKFLLMLTFFSNIGRIVYHQDVPDVLVLDPQWLADQLCKLISFKKEWIEDGLLTREDLKKAFQGMTDSMQEEIIKLFRHFRICFPLDNGRELFPCRLPIGMSSSSVWPQLPSGDKNQVSYLYEFSFVSNSLFPEIVVKIHEDASVDKSPAACLFRNRAIYQTRGIPSRCNTCGSSPPRPRASHHLVHMELLYQCNGIMFTVRGQSPCCIATSTRQMIESAAGENTSMSLSILCPKCVAFDAFGISRLEIKPGDPTRHVRCEAGHDLGTQTAVLRGELKFEPRPVPDQMAVEDQRRCPRLFVVLPINRKASVFSKLLPHSLLRDGYAVHFLCEDPDQLHFLSTLGFRLRDLRKFIDKYGGRAYKLLELLIGLDRETLKSPSDPDPFEVNQRDYENALQRVQRSYDQKFPEMKENAKLVDLLQPHDHEDLNRGELKKLLGISSDVGQPAFPNLVPVRIKGEFLWLCGKHAEARLPKRKNASRSRKTSTMVSAEGRGGGSIVTGHCYRSLSNHSFPSMFNWAPRVVLVHWNVGLLSWLESSLLFFPNRARPKAVQARVAVARRRSLPLAPNSPHGLRFAQVGQKWRVHTLVILMDFLMSLVSCCADWCGREACDDQEVSWR